MSQRIRRAIDELEAKIAEVTRAIGPLAVDGKLDKVQELSALAKELGAAVDSLKGVGKKVSGIERRIEAALRTHTKAGPTCLAITIVWSKLGVQGNNEIIREKKAADSLQKLFSRLAEQFGDDFLLRAGELRSGDRPFVSRRPAVDWVNPNSGELYSARPIGRTGWHVLTHTSTKQKIEQIELLKRELGAPRDSITAEAVPRV